MAVKITWYWNFRAQGWSETWYAPNESLPSDPKALTKWDDIYNVRDQLVAKQGIQVGYRLSDPSQQRKTIIKRFPETSVGSTVTDTPTNAWLALASTANGQGRRQVWFRNCDDGWIQYDPANSIWILNPTFNQRFEAFKAAAIKFPLGLRTVADYASSGQKATVTTVAPVGGGSGVTLTLSGAFTPGNVPVIVTGFKRPLSVLNGTYVPYTGYTAAGSTLTLLGKDVASNAATQYPGGGRVRAQQVSYNQLIDMSLVNPRERRVGRAFFVPRGRRPRR